MLRLKVVAHPAPPPVWRGRRRPDSIKLRDVILGSPPGHACALRVGRFNAVCSSQLPDGGLYFVRRKSSATSRRHHRPQLRRRSCWRFVAASSRRINGLTSVLPAGAGGAPRSEVVSPASGARFAEAAVSAGGAGLFWCRRRSLLTCRISRFVGCRCLFRSFGCGWWLFSPRVGSAGPTLPRRHPSPRHSIHFNCSPSLCLMSVSAVPAACEGISASTLSVEISNSGSSRRQGRRRLSAIL